MIDIALTNTISLLEALWVIVNFLGAYYSLLNWLDARKTLRAARTPPVDRVAVILAKMATGVQRSIGIAQAGFGVIGLLSWLTPAAPHNKYREFTVLYFILLAGVLAYNSYQVNRERRAAVALLEDEHREHMVD